ncbi:lipase family protein [Photorhabdus laumondii]|uniref:Lipase n=1 Tax=Photorhabdus laumondii subsp. clarkei TaxID=2029685 RepID=A0A329VNX8_9GAMM|nr:lipase family protein [Photorhabdus laumondii]PQQ36856.1 lipase [Photorhabdus luminescens]RAW93514.1 lipase [Photorhabdus laumondii subsp. clarkei]
MSTLDPRECFDCRLLKHWVEFQLVDEQGKPLVNMPYSLISKGLPNYVRKGKTDGFGVLREEDLSAHPVTLYIHAQSLADEMEQRPLREKRGEEFSVVKPKAEAEGHQYRYVTIGQISDGLPEIVDWNDPNKIPPPYHFPDPEPKGLYSRPLNCRHVLEVCPFRAWVLLLHHQKEYSIVNAYNQCLMSILAYAGKDVDVEGSVLHFFNRQMVDVSKLPYRMNDISATPVVYDVPFNERYAQIEFIDSKTADKQGDTRLFYIASNSDVLVSWRGTATTENYLTDVTFQPLSLSCDNEKALCSGFIHRGKVHKGFWEAFSLVGELIVPSDKAKTTTVFQSITSLAKNKKLFICGHSLGGALALLHSAQLKEYHPCFYSYGMPRTLTRSAVQELSSIVHYRHVNENDPIPLVPFEQDMDNVFFNYWTPAGYDWEIMKLLSPSPIIQAIKQATASKEIYLHHGKVVHFLKASACPEWLITASNVSLITRLSAEEILSNTTKLYLIPELDKETEHFFSQAGEQQNALFNQLSPQEQDKLFDENKNSELKDKVSILNHFSSKYAGYIDARLKELCEPDKMTAYQDSQRQFKEKMDVYKRFIPDAVYYRNLCFLEMDKQLIKSLAVSQQEEKGKLALQYYCDGKGLSA